MRVLLGLLLAATAASCRTNVALVDDTFGHEHIRDGRFAHVRTARTPLALDALARDGGGQQVRFVLDITIENDRDEAWVVAAAAFGVRAEDKKDATGKEQKPVCTNLRLDLPTGAVLATVPARSDLEVRLPVVLTLGEGMTVHDVESVPIVLTLTEDGTELLERRIVIGTYSQLGQVIRVIALATGGLLLISLF